MKKLPLFFALFALAFAGCDEDQDGTPDVLEPTILTVSPHQAPAGSHVTISGLNFTASSTVSVGGEHADVGTIGRTAISVKVPEGLSAGKAEIVVTTNGSASDPFPFTVTEENTPAPEATNFRVTIENVSTPQPFFQSGIFNTPVGASAPGPAFPEDDSAYEFSFHAGPSTVPGTTTRLSFATMFVASNDLFLAPLGEGIRLYDDRGNPTSGDITDQVFLWDAGTEVNEEPGSDSQPPINTGGEDENGVVQLLDEVNESKNGLIVPNIETCYPLINEAVKVTIKNEGTLFTVRIYNLTGDTDLPSPLSPGVYAVHTAPNLLFEVGAPDFGVGLETIAEDGNAAPLGEYAAERTGLIVPLSPGVWAVHQEDAMPLFTSGEPDRGLGLEGIAEDGSAAELGGNLTGVEGVGASAVFNTPVGADAPGPIGPGGSYSFTVTAKPGYNLSLATMFVQSNDLIYTFEDNGLPLFKEGAPVSGNVTDYVFLYDVGTEEDQFPGAGLDQVIRQSSPDAGAPDDDDRVGRLVADGETPAADGFVYPATASVIKIKITPEP
jgi:hypothetical protein